jgi:hypothetical protein
MGTEDALELSRRLYHELQPALEELSLGLGGPAASGVGDGSGGAGAGARRRHRSSRAEAEARKAAAWLVLTDVGRELATFDIALVGAAGRASAQQGS